MCGKGSTQQTTQVNQADPRAMQAYLDLIQRANTVSQTPYQGYLTGPQGLADYAKYLPQQYGAGIEGLTAGLSPYTTRAQDMSWNTAGIPDPSNAAATDANAQSLANSQRGQSIADMDRNVLGGVGINQGAMLGNYATGAGNHISNYGIQQGGGLSGLGQGLGSGVSNFALDRSGQAPQFQDFNAQTLGQYMSPYNQNVIDATQAQFNHQNALQSNDLLGSAIKSGNAFGGDRAGLAQAELAAGQQRSQAPVIAGLYNQNYAQALGEYNAQQGQAQAGSQLGLQGLATGAGLGLQGATSGAGLGLQGLQSGSQLGLQGLGQGANLTLGGLNQGAQVGLQGAQLGTSGALASAGLSGNLGQIEQGENLAGQNSLLQSGQLAQAQQQRQYDALMQQFQSQLAYPFQTTSFYGNLAQGTGALMGGYGTTTTPAPSQAGQIGGLVGGFGSLLGGLGAAGFLKRGGRADNYAPGGLIPYGGKSLPYRLDDTGVTSYVPDLGAAQIRGQGPPKAPTPPKDTSADDMKSLSKGFTDLGKGFKGIPEKPGDYGGSPESNPNLRPLDSYDTGGGSGGGDSGGGMNFTPYGDSFSVYGRGGLVPHYADGGWDEEDDRRLLFDPRRIEGAPRPPADTFDDRFNAAFSPREREAVELPRDQHANVPLPRSRPEGLGAEPPPDSGGMFGGMGYKPMGWDDGAPPATAGGLGVNPALGYTDASEERAPPPGLAGLAGTPFRRDPNAQTAGEYGGAPANNANLRPMGEPARELTTQQKWQKFADSPWLAAAQGFFGMAASRNPSFAGMMGEGALGGLAALQAQREAQRKIDANPKMINAGDKTIIQYSDGRKLEIPLSMSPYQKEQVRHQNEALAETRRQRDMQEMQPVKIGQDPSTGADVFAVRGKNGEYKRIDPRTGKVGAEIAPAPSAGLSGDEFLATLDPSIANQVKAYVEGRSIPVGNSRTPQVQLIKRLAAQYEPGFDETVYKSREATRRDFSAGVAAKNVSSLNTVMGHLNDLRETADKLNNRGFTHWNDIANWARDKTGYPEVKEFNIARQAVADEMAKVFRSSGMSEAETHRWLETFNSSSSPEQFKSVIGRGLGLLDSRMSALADQYNRGMSLGPNAREKAPEDLLNSSAKEKLEKIRSWIHTDSGAPPTSSGAAPKRVRQNGHTYEQQPDGKYRAID